MTCQTIAKVLERTKGHPKAPPLTSFQLRYPLIIHAELMTHRVFSRNARSSRAVPTARLIEEVMTDPFVPRHWGANQRGMQASVECNEEIRLPALMSDGWASASRESAWLYARDKAVEVAKGFADAGFHKQVANRLLAPFLHIDVVLTATELANWFALRDHEAAEPHIRDLAVAMRAAIEDWDRKRGGPRQLVLSEIENDDWHLPYVSQEERDAAPPHGMNHVWQSVTRCAQVSYVPFHEAKLTVEQEVERALSLIRARPMHASPCEHQALPDTLLPDGSWANPHLAGNLGPGWVQYRKTLNGECA